MSKSQVRMPNQLDLFESLNPNTPYREIELNQENLEALLGSQYLQRVFWVELWNKLDDFALCVYPRGYNFYEYLFIKDSVLVDEDEWTSDENMYSPAFIPVDWELDEDPVWVTITREERTNDGRFKINEEVGSEEPWLAQASPNLNFKETLKWDVLQLDKKIELFRLLKFGLEQDDSDLSEASEHFLGCMARHPDTPIEVIQSLKELNNKLIKDCLR